jgi:hypothetical protein
MQKKKDPVIVAIVIAGGALWSRRSLLAMLQEAIAACC